MDIKNELIGICNKRLLDSNIQVHNIILHGSKVVLTPFSEVDILIVLINELDRKQSHKILYQLKLKIWKEKRCILDFNIIEKSLLEKRSNTSLYYNRILKVCPRRLYGEPVALSKSEMQEVLNYKFQSIKARFPELKLDEKISLGIFLYLADHNISLPSLIMKSNLFEWFEILNKEDADYLLLRDLIVIIKTKNAKFFSKLFRPSSNRIDKLSKYLENKL